MDSSENKPGEPDAPHSGADKLYWEVEKLKEETRNLRRPFLHNPNTIITALTILIAVLGVILQYFKSDREYQLAEIKRQQAEIDIKRLGDDKNKIELARAEAAKRYDALQIELKAAEDKLRNLRAQLEAKVDPEDVRKALEQNPPEVHIFDNSNIDLVRNGPTRPTRFSVKQNSFITSIWNYHWNDGRGADPRKRGISLRRDDGAVFGPWEISTSAGQGGAPNVNWETAPKTAIPAGSYTVIDPDPATWSYNESSGNAGFTKVKGYAIK